MLKKFTIFMMPLFCLLSNSWAEIIPVVDPSSYDGKTISEYPTAMLVSKTKYYNIFWSSARSCAVDIKNDHVVDQSKVREVQLVLEKGLVESIDRLEARAQKLIPNWKTQVSNKLYPFHVMIEVASPIICGGANKRTLIVDGGVTGTPISVPNQFIVESGGYFQSEDEKSGFLNIKMHELGHLILRTIDYPVYSSEQSLTYAPLEESFADFVGMIGTEGSPYAGMGLGTQIQSKYCSKLSSLSPGFERLKLEAICRPVSQKAMRDFTLPLMYQDAFRLTESHHLAAHVNSLLYRFAKEVGLDLLFKHFTSMMLQADRSLLDIELYKPMKRLSEHLSKDRPASTKALNTAMSDLRWKPAKPVNVTPDVSFNKNPTQGAGQTINVTLSNETLSTIWNEGIVLFNPIISDSRGAKFSFTDFTDFWHPQVRLIEDATCSMQRKDCICGDSFNSLKVDILFLDVSKNLRRSHSVAIPTQTLDTSKCYKVSL